MNTGSGSFILICSRTLAILWLAFATFNLTADQSDSALIAAANRPNLIPSNVGLSSYSIRPGDLLAITYTMTNTTSRSSKAL